jgi:hypothetical protein
MFALDIPFVFHFFQVVVAVCFKESPFAFLPIGKTGLFDGYLKIHAHSMERRRVTEPRRDVCHLLSFDTLFI